MEQTGQGILLLPVEGSGGGTPELKGMLQGCNKLFTVAAGPTTGRLVLLRYCNQPKPGPLM